MYKEMIKLTKITKSGYKYMPIHIANQGYLETVINFSIFEKYHNLISYCVYIKMLHTMNWYSEQLSHYNKMQY